jgi:hypothetical protein
MKVLKITLVGIIILLAAGLFFYRYSTIDKGRNDFVWMQPEIDRTEDQYSVMTINVGNSDIDCKSYNWKLCKQSIEQRLAKNIQTVAPDIITIQEVLASWQCEQAVETNTKKVCAETQIVPQVRRLLGDNYTIVCGTESQYECFGVRKDVGEIEGCSLGDLCYNARYSPVPNGCDNGFSISAITVKLNNGTVFDLVNTHPASFSEECRTKLLLQAFIGNQATPTILKSDNVLIMGDFNLDPWRTHDSSSDAWQSIFDSGWRGKKYKYHSGIAEEEPPLFTFKFIKYQTLDLVISNFAKGVCMVLGESPGTARIDGGSGNDHRAVYGVLELKP